MRAKTMAGLRRSGGRHERAREAEAEAVRHSELHTLGLVAQPRGRPDPGGHPRRQLRGCRSRDIRNPTWFAPSVRLHQAKDGRAEEGTGDPCSDEQRGNPQEEGAGMGRVSLRTEDEKRTTARARWRRFYQTNRLK